LIAAPPAEKFATRRHLGGIGRDAARGDTVIAGEHRDHNAIEPRLLAALPARQPDRKLFETAEAARWLCQHLLPGRRGVRGR
jgi:hypothetical protein